MQTKITATPQHLADHAHLVREANAEGNTLNLYLCIADEATAYEATRTTEDGIYFQDLGPVRDKVMDGNYTVAHEILMGDAYEGPMCKPCVELFVDGFISEEVLAFNDESDADADEPVTLDQRADEATKLVQVMIDPKGGDGLM